MLLVILMLTLKGYSQDPNFYIYLCFGQSNMEGQGTIEAQDQIEAERLELLQALDCSNLSRDSGVWYPAIAPTSRCWNGLSPADYFGRTMVANLPDSIRVGIVNVSVGGCKIELYDKDGYQDYVSSVTEDWLINIINEYDGNPYQYLVDLAKQAQQDGVIKGILLHQGESNTNDADWPAKVRDVYDSLMVDLNLDPAEIPLLAGEVVHADQQGVCASMNSIIAALPDTLPNSYVISSSGCAAASDNLHFSSAGYRELGRRYAVQMLSIMGIEMTSGQGSYSLDLEAECVEVGADWTFKQEDNASNNVFITTKDGTANIDEAPNDSSGVVYFTFTLDTAGIYGIYSRCRNVGYAKDSYWIKLDDGEFEFVEGLSTAGWEWLTLMNVELSEGEHTLAFGICEEGTRLDKVNISNFLYGPSDKGAVSANLCEPAFLTDLGCLAGKADSRYVLGQNYPNPVIDETRISFDIPAQTYVSLKVYTLQGTEVAELAGKEYTPGGHIVEFAPGNIPSGTYYYVFRAGDHTLSGTMNIVKGR
ncbi:MAG: hypothetical protein JW801_10615 [Bacteroidales bacterium]|nr:hypothetical protein [Bacteroidales bacterium]